MPTPIIKICGITNTADAELSAELGADWLGFNFFPPSPRYLEPAAAAGILSELAGSETAPSGIKAAGIFVNATNDEILALLEQCPLDFVQLHGDETNDQCRRLEQALRNSATHRETGIIKALRIKAPEDIARVNDYDTPLILLDAFREQLYGGTGHAFDWSWLTRDYGKRILLAGGITPATITEAMALGTWGIDLCSGVEAAPGRKDPDRLRELFQKIEQKKNTPKP